jgi:hypothetical protein
MIIEGLAIFVFLLLIGHFLISFIGKREKYDKQKDKWKTAHALEFEVETIQKEKTQTKANEQEFLNYGKVIANEQKVNVLNKRLGNLEQTVATIAKTQVENSSNEHKGVDLEKIEFKIKVLEQQIDDIKNPKAKPDTFYGQKNDPMEATIKSLVFNSKKK